jgi:hypothetical protein
VSARIGGGGCDGPGSEEGGCDGPGSEGGGCDGPGSEGDVAVPAPWLGAGVPDACPAVRRAHPILSAHAAARHSAAIPINERNFKASPPKVVRATSAHGFPSVDRAGAPDLTAPEGRLDERSPRSSAAAPRHTVRGPAADPRLHRVCASGSIARDDATPSALARASPRTSQRPHLRHRDRGASPQVDRGTRRVIQATSGDEPSER